MDSVDDTLSRIAWVSFGAFLGALISVGTARCSQHDQAVYGTVHVTIADCREPQRGWIADEMPTMAALGPTWVVAYAGEPVDVTVRCADTGPSGGAGEFRGTDEVLLDPAKAPGEFATRSVTAHELIHWRIFRGPRPLRARYHVCDDARGRDDCAPGLFSRDAVMNPGTHDPDGGPTFSEVYTGPVAQHVPQESDMRLFRWGLGMTEVP